MFAVGHLALGYLTGKVASKILNVDVNIPLLFAISVISDVDLLIPGLEHRGPTHSIIMFLLISLPTFIYFRRRSVPYVVALAQHSIIGDYPTGRGTMLLWPLSSDWYGLGIPIASTTNIITEWVLFIAFVTSLFTTKDVWILLKNHPSNLLLSIPVLTVLLPSLFMFPIYVPLELMIPHLAYMTLFVVSILVDLAYFLGIL